MEKKKQIVILGNGVAGFSAAAQIRELDSDSRIVLMTMEDEYFYNRMLLSKGLGDPELLDDIVMETPNWYVERNIDNLLMVNVLKICTDSNQVIYKEMASNEQTQESSQEQTITYDVLIYALGAQAFVPNIRGVKQNGVTTLRTLSDAKKIQKSLDNVNDIVIVGGGILGLEAAWQCAKQGKKVSIIEAGQRLMEKQLDEEGSEFLNHLLADKGIQVYADHAVMEIITADDASHISGVLIANQQMKEEAHEVASVVKEHAMQQTIPAQLVILACGIAPNTQIATQADITTDRGVLVDDTMQTSVENVFACGDCVQMRDKSRTHGLWPEASEMGKTAGINAVHYLNGETLAEHYLSEKVAFYYKGLDTVIFSIGQIGIKQDSLTDWAIKNGITHQEMRDSSAGIYEKYYYHKDEMVGAILIGVPEKITKVNETIGVKS